MSEIANFSVQFIKSLFNYLHKVHNSHNYGYFEV